MADHDSMKPDMRNAIPMGDWYIKNPDPEPGTLNGHSVQFTEPHKKLAEWQAEDREMNLLSRGLDSPVSLSCSVALTVSMLENFGNYPNAVDDFWPLRFTELSVKKLRTNELSSAVERELGQRKLRELVDIRSGMLSARSKDVVGRLSPLSQATVAAVEKTMDAAVKAALPPLKAAQKLLRTHVESMCDAARWNVHALNYCCQAALRQSRTGLRDCGFSGSDEETYGMLKDAIARLIDEKVLFAGHAQYADTARYYASRTRRKHQDPCINLLLVFPQSVVEGAKEYLEGHPESCEPSICRVKRLLAKLPPHMLAGLYKGWLPFPPELVEDGQREAACLIGKHALLISLLRDELERRSVS